MRRALVYCLNLQVSNSLIWQSMAMYRHKQSKTKLIRNRYSSSAEIKAEHLKYFNHNKWIQGCVSVPCCQHISREVAIYRNKDNYHAKTRRERTERMTNDNKLRTVKNWDLSEYKEGFIDIKSVMHVLKLIL